MDDVTALTTSSSSRSPSGAATTTTCHKNTITNTIQHLCNDNNTSKKSKATSNNNKNTKSTNRHQQQRQPISFLSRKRGVHVASIDITTLPTTISNTKPRSRKTTSAAEEQDTATDTTSSFTETAKSRNITLSNNISNNDFLQKFTYCPISNITTKCSTTSSFPSAVVTAAVLGRHRHHTTTIMNATSNSPDANNSTSNSPNTNNSTSNIHNNTSSTGSIDNDGTNDGKGVGVGENGNGAENQVNQPQNHQHHASHPSSNLEGSVVSDLMRVYESLTQSKTPQDKSHSNNNNINSNGNSNNRSPDNKSPLHQHQQEQEQQPIQNLNHHASSTTNTPVTSNMIANIDHNFTRHTTPNPLTMSTTDLSSLTEQQQQQQHQTYHMDDHQSVPYSSAANTYNNSPNTAMSINDNSNIMNNYSHHQHHNQQEQQMQQQQQEEEQQQKQQQQQQQQQQQPSLPPLPLPPQIPHSSTSSIGSSTSSKQSKSITPTSNNNRKKSTRVSRKRSITATTSSTTSNTSSNKSSIRRDKTSSNDSYNMNTRKKKLGDNDGRWSKRFAWPDELHRDFVAAIFDVGLKHSSPSSIMEQMSSCNPNNTKNTSTTGPTNDNNTDKHKTTNLADQVTSERVKSHLQKYRLNRQKSKKDFMNNYDITLDKLKNGSFTTEPEFMNDGQVAAHLSWKAMNEGDTSEQSLSQLHYTSTRTGSSSINPGSQNMGNISQWLCNDGQQGGVLHLPTLTEEEKNSPIGASLGYLMGLFFSLKKQLMAQRNMNMVEGGGSSGDSFDLREQQKQQQLLLHDLPVNMNSQTMYDPNNGSGMNNINGAMTNQGPTITSYYSDNSHYSTQPLVSANNSANSFYPEPLPLTYHSGQSNEGMNNNYHNNIMNYQQQQQRQQQSQQRRDQLKQQQSPQQQQQDISSSMEESRIMKRDMRNQMAFQNKMRQLKQQELNKYLPQSGEVGGLDANNGNNNHDDGVAKKEYHGDDFWSVNRDIDDEQLFDFLMNDLETELKES